MRRFTHRQYKVFDIKSIFRGGGGGGGGHRPDKVGKDVRQVQNSRLGKISQRTQAKFS